MKNLAIAVAAAALLSAAPTASISAPDGMVYVPAGPFTMGSNVGDTDESPQHLATTKRVPMKSAPDQKSHASRRADNPCT